MSIQVVKLGTERGKKEGIRLGTVRRPPRGVRKTEYATQNWYDVWLPILSPSPDLMKKGKLCRTEKEWSTFEKAFRKEMSAPEASRMLDVLVAFSQDSQFSIGCYCDDEDHCHRSILRALLDERGAKME